MKFFNQKLTKIIFVLGGPGAGKGVQSKLLANFLKASHISAGDCLRQEIQRKSNQAQKLNQIIKSGKIVPAQITVRLLLKKIKQNEAQYDKFIIDGFPRNQDNKRQWFQEAKVEVSHVVHLLCSEEQLRRRIMQRGKVSGRQDDNLLSFANRMQVYRNETLPVIQWWKKSSGSRMLQVQGEGPIEEVFRRLLKEME